VEELTWKGTDQEIKEGEAKRGPGRLDDIKNKDEAKTGGGQEEKILQ